jgi:hypothetical protein
MSYLDKLSVRFTAFVLVIILLGFAVHLTEAGIHSDTLDQHKADDKSLTR